jgi:mRNA interferase YafQ
LILKPVYTKRFSKDIKKAVKRGLELEKLKKIVEQIVNGKPLARSHKDHLLVGNYVGRRECHIEPDWLLIYKPVPEEDLIVAFFGTHIANNPKFRPYLSSGYTAYLSQNETFKFFLISSASVEALRQTMIDFQAKKGTLAK